MYDLANVKPVAATIPVTIISPSSAIDKVNIMELNKHNFNVCTQDLSEKLRPG